MRRDVLKDKWKHVRNELIRRWNQLTSEDIDRIGGRRDNLVDLLEYKYGYARRRAEREVEGFVTEFEDRLRKAS